MNDFDDFHSALVSYYPLPQKSSKKIYDHLHYQKCEKEIVITSEGELESHIYFVMDGVLQSYFLKEDKKYIIGFDYPPSFTGVLDSFLNETKANFTIESITKCEFLCVSRNDLHNLMAEDIEIDRLMRAAATYVLSNMIQRHYELMALSIEERFKAFASRSARLFQLIPQKHIASYLNMHPTNFSKLMNKTRI